MTDEDASGVESQEDGEAGDLIDLEILRAFEVQMEAEEEEVHGTKRGYGDDGDMSGAKRAKRGENEGENEGSQSEQG